MNHRRLATAFLLVAACALGTAGCERVKSANPLSPAIAGPIPGVEITAPKPLLPEQNTMIVATEQPLDLLIENAGTSGVRPLWLDVELAMDLNFENMVHQAERVAPGDEGRTTYRMPALLPAETTYYWRARAADGANTGPYSPVASFRILEPVVLGPPEPITPIGQISGFRPEFRVRNGSVSGHPGNLFYRIEIGTAPGASGMALTVTPHSGGVTVASAGDLQPNTTYFWRVAQSDGQYWSPYSHWVEFRTGAPAPAPPLPGPGPAPGVPGAPSAHCGPQPLGADRLPCVQAVAATSAEWAQCTAGNGVACFRFTREVARELAKGDPNWGILAKSGNQWQCSNTQCGSNVSGQGYGEDIVAYCTNPATCQIPNTHDGRTDWAGFDVVVGAGLPGANVSWQVLSQGWNRGNNWWAVP